MENLKIENYDLCAKCGGFCCKKSGCDYVPSDFNSLAMNDIIELLNSNNISIVSQLMFDKLSNGKLVCQPFLYLRARNTGRDAIDLFSFKTKCSLLTDTGCKLSYEERPTGGKNLIPKENMKCYHTNNPQEDMKKWEAYQKVLAKVVKKVTGKTVEDKMIEDIRNVFNCIYERNYENVSDLEISQMAECMQYIVRAYSDEYVSFCNEKHILKLVYRGRKK